MDTIIFYMTTRSCFLTQGVSGERLSLVNVVPSKNELGHFVIHYENSLTQRKQGVGILHISFYIQDISLFSYKMQEGKKIIFSK